MVFHSGDRSFGDDYGKGMGFISHHEIEWRLDGDRVGVVIVCEFCMENLVSLGGGIRSTKDL